MADDNDDNDFEVGYGKPPKEHQFKKGESGNPKGRPKGAKSHRNLIKLVTNEMVELTIGGQKRRMPVKEALIRRTVIRALQGDRAALKQVLLWLEQTDPEVATRYVIEAPAPMTPEEWDATYGAKDEHERHPAPKPEDSE